MDYEKKYNDLVNDLKELWNCHTNDSQLLGELAEICPELAESEDERIRKHLIAIVELYWGKTNDPDKAKDLAYLEKLKEQKPVEWSEEDENALIYLHELISFGFTEKFCDAQTASDMRMWLNTRLKSLRPVSKESLQSHWKPSEENEEPEYSTF